jgi:hypothetical protein
MTIQNIPPSFVGSGKPLERFSRSRLVFSWLLFAEGRMSHLTMLLLGPTLGAVIGTAVAVSDLSTTTINGKVVATVPSLWDVLWPALAFGAGGVAVLMLGCVAVGVVLSYRSGIGPWEAKIADDGTPVLRPRSESPTTRGQLGAVDCVLKLPSGKYEWSDRLEDGHEGMYGAVSAPDVEPVKEPGVYEMRWYATEHKRLIHEIARLKHNV